MLAREEHDPSNARLRGLADNEIDFPAFWQALEESESNITRAGPARRESGDDSNVALLPANADDPHLEARAAGIHGIKNITVAHAQHPHEVVEISA